MPHAYSEFYVGLTLTLLILVAWSTRRHIRGTPGGLRETVLRGKRAYARRIGTIAARSLISAGVVALLMYLAAAPTAIDEREAWFQRHYPQFVDVTAASRELDTQIAAIQSDVALMAELRRKAEN